MKRKRIPGYVEEEELLKMKRCLMGIMATVCSVRNIISRLSEWGMEEIKVQRLGGKIYLLTIEDDELYMMLEDLDWSYLKEIFCEVSPWSESLNHLERATWLEISGVPLHYWNSTTLKRLAGVFELGFSDSSIELKNRNGVVNNEYCKVNKEFASVTTTSSKSEKEELEGDRSISVKENKVFNEAHNEKVFNYYQARDSETQGCKIGELELMGGGIKEISQLGPENQGKPFGGPKEPIFPEGRELLTLKNDEDVGDMGFNPSQKIADSGTIDAFGAEYEAV
ncbi:hypothetical protein V6N13_018334 [Hibiscus sabdariffa]